MEDFTQPLFGVANRKCSSYFFFPHYFFLLQRVFIETIRPVRKKLFQDSCAYGQQFEDQDQEKPTIILK